MILRFFHTIACHKIRYYEIVKGHGKGYHSACEYSRRYLRYYDFCKRLPRCGAQIHSCISKIWIESPYLRHYAQYHIRCAESYMRKQQRDKTFFHIESDKKQHQTYGCNDLRIHYRKIIYLKHKISYHFF